MMSWLVRTKNQMMMSEQRRSTLNDVVTIPQTRKFEISIFEDGNVLTVKSESPLLDASRMESFDYPLRQSSGPALTKTTSFGGHLVTRTERGVAGATNIQLQLYQATVVLGGIYGHSEALKQMEEVVRSLCNDAWIEPNITTILHASTRKKDVDKEYVHPFGRLCIRLHEVRQRGRRKLVK